MTIKAGIWFGTGLDMGIHHKPFIVSTIALRSCPSSKLVLGQFVLDQSKQVDSYNCQIFANPEFPSKRKRRTTPFGAGYTEYQPEIIFLDLFRGKNVFFVEPIIKLQRAKVLLNLYRQPYH